jgi:hypothetical protein
VSLSHVVPKTPRGLFCRRGWSNWYFIAEEAIAHGKLDCLRFALDQDPSLSTEGEGELSKVAEEGGQLACLKLLHERGCDFSTRASRYNFQPVTESDHAECLDYMLDHMEVDQEEMLNLFYHVVYAPKCLQVLYDKGCLPRTGDVYAMLRLSHVSYECIKILIANSGRPPPRDIIHCFCCL